jgi:flagellar basal body L-ring protein FlgH
MNRRVGTLLLICAAFCASSSPKKKKSRVPPEPSPLDKYISDAYRDYMSPEAAPPPGSTWSQNALLPNLGMDLRASRVEDLVTIVVSETFSAVATGDVKTQGHFMAERESERPCHSRVAQRLSGLIA